MKKPIYVHDALMDGKSVKVYSFYEVSALRWANSTMPGSLTRKGCLKYCKKGTGTLYRERRYSESNATDHLYSDKGSFYIVLLFEKHPRKKTKK